MIEIVTKYIETKYNVANEIRVIFTEEDKLFYLHTPRTLCMRVGLVFEFQYFTGESNDLQFSICGQLGAWVKM